MFQISSLIERCDHNEVFLLMIKFLLIELIALGIYLF